MMQAQQNNTEVNIMNEILKVSNLTKTFCLSRQQQKIEKTKLRKRVAVSDLSFSLQKGEVFGLLGTNGAGKTTTLRMIATLIKPDKGTIILDGVDAAKDPELIRSKIGFLTSELKLEDFFTPNYMFDYFSKLHNVDPEIAKGRKKVLFQSLGIDQFEEVKIGQLSTGMKQKISIAISLVHYPDVIIFDEPTNGLDIITAKTVTDFLMTLKEAGKTIVISSHIFSLIEKTCDRVGIMVDGQMVLTDSLSNILTEASLEDKFFQVYNNIKEDAHHA